MPALDLVILDCDGVLVDSEPVTTALLAEMACELGWDLTTEEAAGRFRGRKLAEVQRVIEATIESSLGDSFIPSFRRRMNESFETNPVPPVPGAAGLLDSLDHAGVTHAVASNGPEAKMRLTLGGIRWRNDTWLARFDGRRFSAYDVGTWKPDPGLFLHVAASFDVPPEQCVVIEDSTSGVRAAVAAGMRIVGFARESDAAELRQAGAEEVFESHREVAAHLRLPWRE